MRKYIDKQDKPRLAEVLGVEVEEVFKIKTFSATFSDLHIAKNGTLRHKNAMVVGDLLCWIINHPESIIRGPHLTEPEIAIMRVLGAKWVSRDLKDGDVVSFWDREPVNKYGSGVYIWAPEAKDSYVGEARASLFPSVKPGDCIRLEV